MEFKEFVSTFLMIAGSLFGYHKYIINYVDKKKDEVDKEMETLHKNVNLRDTEIKEQIKELKKASDLKDNEIKELIKELKQDIKDWKKELKEEINYIRDKECLGKGVIK